MTKNENKDNFSVLLCSSSPTRGFRNFNLLNIRKNKINDWRGQVGSDDDGFCRFENYSYGIRAALLILRTYILKYGCNTVKDVIKRWAPSSDGNHVESYVDYITHRYSTLGHKDSLCYGTSSFCSVICKLVSSMIYYESLCYVRTIDIQRIIRNDSTLNSFYLS